MVSGTQNPWPSLSRTTLVGRAREHCILRSSLEAALAGHGSLALISGEAGIGKTALVRALADEAISLDCLVLSGACYDGASTPPYGLWRELISATTRRDDLPKPSRLLLSPDSISSAPRREAIVAALQALFDTLVERGPLMLVLEDLHWADPESLDFLRIFARQVATVPLLLIATYRDEDLALSPALYQVVPHLVREANAQRIGLRRLDESIIETLVTQRYDLHESDLARLTAHLEERSHGVPFYMTELLRTLEEEQRLRHTPDGWVLGDLGLTQVPVLVKQVIEGRFDRFDPELRRLLELAAVIGQDVPLLLWRRVSGADENLYGEAVERASQAHVLEGAPSGLHLQFTHALVRDALYEGLPLPRRQLWHRRIAEALTGEVGVEPDMVAHHFRQALDPRAIQWFIRAGSRAERVAWMTAATHFESALEMMSGGDADPSEKGWLLVRRAKLLHGAEPRTSLAILEAAEELALDTCDALLLAYIKFFRGQSRCLVGEMRAGMADLEASSAEFARLSSQDIERAKDLERDSIVPSRGDVDGLLAALLAVVGRINEALDRSQAIIERASDVSSRLWWARAIALSLAGRFHEATETFAVAHEALLRTFDETSSAVLLLYQLVTAQLPYGADELAERRRIASEGEAAWRRSGGALGDVSPRIASLPLLLIEGDWQEARELALHGTRSSDATSEKYLVSTVILAQLARAQGDASLARSLVHRLLPGGPQTVPGNVDFAPALALMCVAASLCLDDGDLPRAHAWLETHDRWLEWSGAVLGQADGQLLWSQYYQVVHDLPRARHHAARALELAANPRQPLALLSAHRSLGEIEAHSGRIADAQSHLGSALSLSDRCNAPYERALTLVAFAEFHRRAGATALAQEALDEARAICVPLKAALTLARADAVAARLSELAAAITRTTPSGLSPREIEVLRLLATGRSNREIAETFFLSVRTVERHITNLYAKLGVAGRSEAIAYAHEHHLI